MSDFSIREYLGLAEEYWDRISDQERELLTLIRPAPKASYEANVQLRRLPNWIDELRDDMQRAGGALELEPDFQRGHVWTPEQRSHFMESYLRGQAEARFTFNCPTWQTHTKVLGDIPANLMQCIDGLQRLTTLVEYVKGNVPVFGGMTVDDFAGTSFDAKRLQTKLFVHEFIYRADLLQYYLDINSGGTVHKPEELDRVRELLAKHKKSTSTPGLKP